MSAATELSPLLSRLPKEERNQKYCSCTVNYRLPKITQKGAIVMIVCNTLAFITISAQFVSVYSKTSTLLTFVVMVMITSPSIGIAADICIGRFKLIQAGIVVLLLSSLIKVLLIPLQYYLPITAEYVLVQCVVGLCCIGTSCYVACIFPFTANQLIGASGEQLSFTVYWMMWGLATSSHIIQVQFPPSYLLGIVLEVIPFASISLMVFILVKCQNLLSIFPQLSNSYKLIFKVLSYARKHKYPERRSAFTYWEEGTPSRLDLGMSKYGGPFTVEEVEDVKTFFRLLPVIICAGGCNVGLFTNWYMLLDAESSPDDFQFNIFASYLSRFIIVCFGIPIYHFLLYPLFYNYIPTMLNRIRIGFVLEIVSICMYAIVGDLLVCNTLLNTTCLLFQSQVFNVSNNGGWWIMGPTAVYGVGYLVSFLTLLEFVVAQSPYPLSGVLAGFTHMSNALGASLGYGIYVAISTITNNVHIWFCGNLSLAFVTFVYFMLFHYIAKRYKLRKRDDIVPIHLFAEEFFEKELKGRKMFEEECSHWYKRSNMLN